MKTAPKTYFRKGQIYTNERVAVLVTGRGDKTASYPTFAGVVVWSRDKETQGGFSIGTFSRTWSCLAVFRTTLKLAEIVRRSLDNTPGTGESAIEFLRKGWVINAEQVRKLSIDPNMQATDLTIQQLSRLAGFLKVYIEDIVKSNQS